MSSTAIQAIEASYGSLDHPDWSFLPKRIEEGLCDDFVNKLVEVGSIQETTDQNDNCSRCLFLTSETESLTLRLSLVGKFACIHDGSGRFVSELDQPSGVMGEELSRLLKSNGFELVNERCLREEIKFGGENRTDVLFSSDGLI